MHGESEAIESYICEICGRSFKEIWSLVAHCRIHTGEKPYVCETCNRGFILKSTLVSHRLTHSGERPHFCEICNKRFRQKPSLVYHQRSHTGEKPFMCDHCDKRFVTNSARNQHLKVHTKKKSHRYICEICNASFASHYKFVKHQLVHSNKKCFKCDLCDKANTWEKDLSMHRRTHVECPAICKLCKISFSCHYSLKKHQKLHTLVHSNKKCFKCDLCDRAYTWEKDLSMHRCTHFECPAICKLCKISFSCHYSLKKHQKLHTGGKKVTTHICEVCNKGFRYKHGLLTHQLTHIKKESEQVS